MLYTLSVFVGLYYEPDAGKPLVAVRQNLYLGFHSLYYFDMETVALRHNLL